VVIVCVVSMLPSSRADAVTPRPRTLPIEVRRLFRIAMIVHCKRATILGANVGPLEVTGWFKALIDGGGLVSPRNKYGPTPRNAPV
jgi:hypothetical protein